MLFKILVADIVAPEGLKLAGGCEEIDLVQATGLDEAGLVEAAREVHAIVVRSGAKITAAVIEAAPLLKVVGRAGIGVDNIDVKAASARGVLVMNTPLANTVSTAEHALAMMFALARKVPAADKTMKDGRWDKKQFKGIELYRKTLGIVGLGKIGQVVADRARGLKMRVIAADPFVSEERAESLGIELVDLDGLLAQSDFISVHTPMTPETRGMLNRDSLAKAKDGVRIVNCARGGIVDEEALLYWLDQGKIAGAALDVYQTEPPQADDRLVKHPAVICTPHIAASTAEAQMNVSVEIFEQIVSYLTEGRIVNAVNLPAISLEDEAVLRPYIQLQSRLGCFQAQTLPGRVKRIDILYKGALSALDLTYCTNSYLAGYLSVFSEDPVNLINAAAVARTRGLSYRVSRTETSTTFSSSIEVTCHCAGGVEYMVAGAIVGIDEPRIVGIDHKRVDVHPHGVLLVIENQDKPGVMGKVGTMLGNASINISQMQLGLDRITGRATAFFSLASQPPKEVTKQLKQLPELLSVRVVVLPEAPSTLAPRA